jgi:hypothetical protein
MLLLSFAYRVISGKPGYPIDSTEGMPVFLINIGALMGIAFLVYVLYLYFSSKKDE